MSINCKIALALAPKGFIVELFFIDIQFKKTLSVDHCGARLQPKMDFYLRFIDMPYVKKNIQSYQGMREYILFY